MLLYVDARNVIFVVDNCSSSHTDNFKNKLLGLGEGPTDEINSSIGAAKRSLVLIFVNQRQNYA